jgi:hypothetical protein
MAYKDHTNIILPDLHTFAMHVVLLRWVYGENIHNIAFI